MIERPKITLVVAATEDGVIGLDGALPWHIPEDLKHFRTVTTGKAILMGRKTFESIGRPLPNRRNLVLTTDRNWGFSGTETVHSLDEAIALLSPKDELMVIGGEQLYKLALPYANEIQLTEIRQSFQGDTYFPNPSKKNWVRKRETPLISQEGVLINFVTLSARDESPNSYLTLKLDDVLQKYGEGGHIPGSGSAAALQGLLAARLVATVVSISLNKDYKLRNDKHFRYIDHQLSTVHLPELTRLFDADIVAFDDVYQLRVKRDATTNAVLRKNIISQERRRLQKATKIPADIALHCLKIGEHALYAYRHGYRAVRGDSGAAISSACAGALTAAFVIGTNLTRFPSGIWHKKWSTRAHQIELEAAHLVSEAISEVESVRIAAENTMEPEFDL